MTTSQTLSIPRALGPYRIERELCSGAMGTVFLAVHTGLERIVALKVLRPDTPVGPESVRRFVWEARSAARLDHPNIVPVYDAGEVDGIPYIAMKLLEGETLESLLSRTGSLPLDRIVRIAAQLAAALDYAHGHDVVHLDVKPANVMVARRDRVTLTDFGIAQALTAYQAPPATILGTPMYMSPEQILGEAVDRRSDIYSLGLVMYEMCVGRPPFQGSCAMVLHAHLHVPVPDVRVSVSDVPAEFAAVLDRAMAKHPSHRFQTAAGLHRALIGIASASPSVPTAGAAPKHRLSDPHLLNRSPSPVQALPPTSESIDQTAVLPIRHPVEGRGESGAEERRVWSTHITRLPGSVRILPVVLIAMLGALLLAHPSGTQRAKAFAPPTLALSITGAHRGNGYVSNELITLRWTRLPHVERYRLQEARWSTNLDDSVTFRHPLRTDLIEGTSRTIRVAGYQVYYWRVQAQVNDRWGPYTRPNRIIVSRPIIPRPVPLLPKNGTAQMTRKIRLCWSRIRGVVAYRLEVTGLVPLRVRNTCVSLPVRAHTYRWSVSAYVNGAQLYIGPLSTPWRFSILERPTATLQPTSVPRVSERPSPTPAPTVNPSPTPSVRPRATVHSKSAPPAVTLRPNPVETRELRHALAPRLAPRPVRTPIPRPTPTAQRQGFATPQRACDPEVEPC